jgi:hypothetical protein
MTTQGCLPKSCHSLKLETKNFADIINFRSWPDLLCQKSSRSIFLPIGAELTALSRIDGGRRGVSANFRAVSVAKFGNRASGSVPKN